MLPPKLLLAFATLTILCFADVFNVHAPTCSIYDNVAGEIEDAHALAKAGLRAIRFLIDRPTAGMPSTKRDTAHLRYAKHIEKRDDFDEERARDTPRRHAIRLKNSMNSFGTALDASYMRSTIYRGADKTKLQKALVVLEATERFLAGQVTTPATPDVPFLACSSEAYKKTKDPKELGLPQQQTIESFCERKSAGQPAECEC